MIDFPSLHKFKVFLNLARNWLCTTETISLAGDVDHLYSYRSHIFHFLKYLIQRGEAHLLSSRVALGQPMECNAPPGTSVLASSSYTTPLVGGLEGAELYHWPTFTQKAALLSVWFGLAGPGSLQLWIGAKSSERQQEHFCWSSSHCTCSSSSCA